MIIAEKKKKRIQVQLIKTTARNDSQIGTKMRPTVSTCKLVRTRLDCRRYNLTVPLSRRRRRGNYTARRTRAPRARCCSALQYCAGYESKFRRSGICATFARTRRSRAPHASPAGIYKHRISVCVRVCVYGNMHARIGDALSGPPRFANLADDEAN